MSGLNHPVFYGFIMLAAGLGIPVFAALNADLGARLQNPVVAAIIALCVGIVVCSGVMLYSGGVSALTSRPEIPFYTYLGGLFIVFYVLGITWVAPKFGVGNAVAFVLLGQIISMATIDHFSLLGAPHHPVSMQRLIGLGLMVIGVFLSVRK